MVRDRAILSEFLTHKVVQQYSVPRGKISVFTTFGGHLGFYRKMKNCEYLGKGIFSPVSSAGDTYRGSGLVFMKLQCIVTGLTLQ